MMARLLALLVFVLVLPMAGEAAGQTRAEISTEIEQLGERYAARQRELDAHEAQARALAEPGTSLTAYRDLALQVFAARDDLAATQERLTALYRLLDEMGPQLGPFSIVATRNTFDGPPVDLALSTDDLIALRATVPNPTDPALLPTTLVWRIIKGTGEELKDFVVYEEVKTAGGETETNVRFQLKSLEEGLYVATLLHQSTADRSVKREESFAFNVFQAFAIDRLWVTAAAGDETGQETLAASDLPHIYVTYRGSGEIRIALRVRHAQSGALAFAHEWTRPPGKGLLRTGLRLPEGALEAGDRLVAEVTLTAADGATKRATAAFSIGDAGTDRLVLQVPPRIADDQLARFSIGVPTGFAPPYAVDVEAPGLTVALAAAGALQGTIHGRALGRNDSTHQVRVTVTDASGRRASGRAQVTVAARPSASTPSAPAAQAFASPPPGSTRASAPTSPASPTQERTSPKATPGATRPSRPPTQKTPAGQPSPAARSSAAPADAPSAARASECRRLHAALRQALDHFHDLNGKLKAINDGLNQRFLAGYESHKARLKAAGGARRADPALRAETEEYRKFFALAKELAAMEDCGTVVYTVKNSWAARTFGYPDAEATRWCLASSDAKRAASQALSAAKGCLTADGRLRPEFAEGYVAAKKDEKREKGSTDGLPRCAEVTGVNIEAARIVGGKLELGGITMGGLGDGSVARRCKEDGAQGKVLEFPHAGKVCGLPVWFEGAAPTPAAIRRFAVSNKGFSHVAVSKWSDILAHCHVEDRR